MILVTGATGNIGREVVIELGRRGVPFRALLRDPDNRSLLPGSVQTVEGDFAKPETLERALEGIDHAFLVTPSSEVSAELENNFIKAASQAGVHHIVKLSVMGADLHSTCRFMRFHREIEIELEHSGVGWTHLRPNLFMQMTLAYKSTIASQGAIFAPAADSRISMVDVRDIAAVAVTALTEPGHVSKSYVITGPEALTYNDVAQYLSNALGTPVRFVNIPHNVAKDSMLQMRISPWRADGVIELNELYKRGEGAAVTEAVRAVGRKEPIAFAQFARDFAEAFTTGIAASTTAAAGTRG